MIIDRAEAEVRSTKKAVLLLSNQELPPPHGNMPMELLFSSYPEILTDKERFFVYRLGP